MLKHSLFYDLLYLGFSKSYRKRWLLSMENSHTTLPILYMIEGVLPQYRNFSWNSYSMLYTSAWCRYYNCSDRPSSSLDAGLSLEPPHSTVNLGWQRALLLVASWFDVPISYVELRDGYDLVDSFKYLLGVTAVKEVPLGHLLAPQ